MLLWLKEKVIVRFDKLKATFSLAQILSIM
jgi:hypothetical protein